MALADVKKTMEKIRGLKMTNISVKKAVSIAESTGWELTQFDDISAMLFFEAPAEDATRKAVILKDRLLEISGIECMYNTETTDGVLFFILANGY